MKFQNLVNGNYITQSSHWKSDESGHLKLSK